jgi:1,2-dihydroxy-3-keto-5-methylthiopentene dioxygenase
MSLLIIWPDDDPSTVLRQTADPTEIADALRRLGCRLEPQAPRGALPADAGQEVVLAAYRDVVDKIVADEGFLSVDVVSMHPTDDPGWARTAEEARARFIDEHTHGDEHEVRFVVRGAGAFYVHLQGKVHGLYCGAGDLLGLPPGTTHWFDMGTRPDFTTIRFFHDAQGWAGVPTGSDISRRFPDFDALQERARALG